jgi:hypothetical protein
MTPELDALILAARRYASERDTSAYLALIDAVAAYERARKLRPLRVRR